MKTYIYYDVSGSIPEGLFNKFLFEAEWRKSVLQLKETLEFCFDHEVRPLEKAQNYSGCGGTNVDAVRKHFLAHAEEGDGILVFSDGYIPEMDPVPECHPMDMVVLNS